MVTSKMQPDTNHTLFLYISSFFFLKILFVEKLLYSNPYKTSVNSYKYASLTFIDREFAICLVHIS